MPSFSKSMRNRLPAIGLGMMAALGAMTAGSVVLAPAAMAQKADIKFAQPYNEAGTAIGAGNWSLAQQKIDAAAPFAKSAQEKTALELLRYNIAKGKKDNPALLKSTEALIAAGYNVATLKKTLPGLYEATGQSSKALAMLKEQVDGGGGTADQNLQIAAASFKAKNYADAIKYGQKAISMAGAKPAEKYFAPVLESLKAQNKTAEYEALLEKVAVQYPKEGYWVVLFVRIQKDPMYSKAATSKLDFFRIRQAAKIKLNAAEKKDWATSAIYSNLFGEAVTASSGPEGDKGLLAQAQASAAKDKAGLAAEEAASAASGRGADMIKTADKALSYGDLPKAIDLYQKGIAKGMADTSALDYARLHLGIAQFNAGKKADAQATWATIKTDTSAVQFAKHWTLVSKSCFRVS